MDPQKIEAILQWPITKTSRAERPTCYYRCYRQNYGKIVKPLTDLLIKGNLEWTHEGLNTFRKLQNVFTTAPVLVMPDFSRNLPIECDASGKGLGAVFSKKKDPELISIKLWKTHILPNLYMKKGLWLWS